MGRELKRYERNSDNFKYLADGELTLAGIDVHWGSSEVLYSRDEFTEEIFNEEFEIMSGEWYVEDGWIVGKNPNPCPGMIISKADYFGDVMLDVKVKMVEPSTHDINIMINGEWDREKDRRGLAYVAGLEAFWHGNIGFEKSPEYKLIAATSMLDFKPDKEYRFQLGNAGGRLFVLVDGKLGLEINDPDPIDSSKFGKIGFEAFSSWWKMKEIRVVKLAYTRTKERYIPEF